MEHNDDFWMKMAIDLAKESKTPFGAVITDLNGNHVGGYSTTILDGATAHAEMNAIQKIKSLDHDDVRELTIYSTVEPCPMCMSAIIWAGIGKLVYGASIDFAKTKGTQITISSEEVAREAWYGVEIEAGVLEVECEALFGD